MFYENENEKDIINNSSEIQISEDGVVSWGDVLNENSDDIISLDDLSDEKIDTVSSASKKTDTNNDDIINVNSDSNDIDEDELRRMLTDGDNPEIEVVENKEEEATEISNASNDNKQEDLDIDFDYGTSGLSIHNGTARKDDVPEIEVSTRKAPKSNNQSGIMPILIALLVAIAVVGGGYYAYTFMQDKQVDGNDLKMNSQIKEVTKEELVERTNEQQDIQQDIPVVNEDTQNSMKPQEIPQEEQKQTVDIKVGGRANPFLPNSKYLSVSVPDSVINFVNPSIPQPPEEYGNPEGGALQMLTISVSGIMYDDVKPSAIITYNGNDYFVQRGDKLNEYRVIDITKTYVLVALGRNTYKANVGEEFKIATDFYGSAKFLPTGRQYQIVDNNAAKSSANDNSGNKIDKPVEVNIE